MKKALIFASLITFFIAIYFAGTAYKLYLGGDIYDFDKIYLNIGYCSLFLSIAVYALHLKESKKVK